LLLDVARTFNLTGRQAESALRACGITLNRSALPFDKNGPWYTSGLRLGTPAVTTRGLGLDEMKVIARLVARVVRGTTAEPNSRAQYRLAADLTEEVRAGVGALTEAFPLYPELPADV
jgi:glycine hydroxymethyltransferase